MNEDYSTVFCNLYGIALEEDKQLSHWKVRDLQNQQTDYAFDERVPFEYFAIGGADHWPRIALHTCTGMVYEWDTVEPWEPDKINTPTEEWLRPVAMSFGEFLNRIELHDPFGE